MTVRRAAALIAGALLALAANGGDIGVIDQDTLLARLAKGDQDLVVLDVRTAEEYAAGHVPGALNIAHDELEARLAELTPHQAKDLVVYCRSGRRSQLALAVLAAHGFENLWHLEGDVLAWQSANRPLETSARPGAAPAPDQR